METLKSISKHNNCPQNFVNQYIKKFLKKNFVKRDLNFMTPKWELTFALPHLGKISIDLRTKLRQTIRKKFAML